MTWVSDVEVPFPQLALTGQANVEPTIEEWSGRHRHYIVGPTSICPVAQHRQRVGRHWPNIQPTLGQYSANIVGNIFDFSPTSANLLPSFGYWYSHIMFTMLDIIFDVLNMSGKCHISRHALNHDIPMTSLRHLGNMSVTSWILTLLVVFLSPPTCTHRHELF